jgi:hypothetical protein
MNKSTFSVLILLIAIASADDDVQYTYDNDVMVLDEGNFHQAVSKFEYLFLEFYAPWCGHWYHPTTYPLARNWLQSTRRQPKR